MRKKILLNPVILIFIIAVLLAAPARAYEITIRVALLMDQPAVRFNCSKGLTVKDASTLKDIAGGAREYVVKVYDGNIFHGMYEDVIHYKCCEPSLFNIRSNDNMVWFFALKDGYWYYVEAGIYD